MVPAGKVTASPWGTSTAAQSRSKRTGSLLREYMLGAILRRMKDTAVRRARWLAPALLVLGSLGCAAAWILLALSTGRLCSWLALLAAIDAALLLRLARMPGGIPRAVLAVLGTGTTIVLAYWGIIASQLARSVGVLPWESALKLGPHHAWTLAGLATTPADLGWLGAGLVLAVALSGRRPAPDRKSTRLNSSH